MADEKTTTPADPMAGVPGSINEPPGSQVIPKGMPDGEHTFTPGRPPIPPEPPVTPPNPVLSNINPSSAKQSAGTVTFNANGSHFYEGSKLFFAGAQIQTAFVNTGQLTGTINTPDYVVGSFLVHVDSQGGGLSINKTFNITSPADDGLIDTAAADPDELEAEIEDAEDEGDIEKRPAAKPKGKSKGR